MLDTMSRLQAHRQDSVTEKFHRESQEAGEEHGPLLWQRITRMSSYALIGGHWHRGTSCVSTPGRGENLVVSGAMDNDTGAIGVSD